MGSIDWYTTENNDSPSTRTVNSQQISKEDLMSLLVDYWPLTSTDFFKLIAGQAL